MTRPRYLYGVIVSTPTYDDRFQTIEADGADFFDEARGILHVGEVPGHLVRHRLSGFGWGLVPGGKVGDRVRLEYNPAPGGGACWHATRIEEIRE